uniref:ABC-2 type transporter transmembrane domain-containing protein n=1 Tax=Zea mays TaxID=4577 RepID=A0A804N7L0_MAIZE
MASVLEKIDEMLLLVVYKWCQGVGGITLHVGASDDLSSIVYPMIGFQVTASKFFWFFLYQVMSFMYYTLYGMMTVALTPNIEIAMGLSFLIFIFWNVFSGFIIVREVTPHLNRLRNELDPLASW